MSDATIVKDRTENPEYNEQFLRIFNNKLRYINIKVLRQVKRNTHIDGEFEIIGETRINVDNFKHFNEIIDINLRHPINVNHLTDNNDKFSVFGSIKVRICKDDIKNNDSLPFTIKKL